MDNNIEQGRQKLRNLGFTDKEIKNFEENAQKKRKEQQRIIDKMFKTDKYIKWLEKFTKENKVFYESDWQYNPEKITDKDRKNIKRLNILFPRIEKYASDNFIYPIIVDNEISYQIKYNGIGYKIGLLGGQGAEFFVERITITDKEHFIDFKDIQTNTPQEKTEYIKERLNRLTELMNKLVDKEIPIEAIEEVTDKTIKNIKEKRKVKLKKNK